jgi:hypothetical protein
MYMQVEKKLQQNAYQRELLAADRPREFSRLHTEIRNAAKELADSSL